MLNRLTQIPTPTKIPAENPKARVRRISSVVDTLSQKNWHSEPFKNRPHVDILQTANSKNSMPNFTASLNL